MSWFTDAFGPDPRMVRVRQKAQTDRVNLRNSAKLGIAQATGVSPAGVAGMATAALGADAANALGGILGNPSALANMQNGLGAGAQPPPPPPSTGISAGEAAVGIVALLALGAAIYFGAGK